MDMPRPVRLFADSFCCLGKRVTCDWSLTQSLDVLQQLQAGIRYFDIRTCVKPGSSGEFFVLHGLYGHRIRNLLLSVLSFLYVHPKEVVFLDFNHFYNMTADTHKQLIDLIQDFFGDKLVPSYFIATKPQDISLRSLYATPHRVFVFYQAGYFLTEAGLWPSSAIVAPWADTDDVKIMVEFLENWYKTKAFSWQFTVAQGVVTPSYNTVAKHLCTTLKKISVPATSTFTDWVASKTAGQHGLNICIADFVETNLFIPTVISLNFK